MLPSDIEVLLNAQLSTVTVDFNLVPTSRTKGGLESWPNKVSPTTFKVIKGTKFQPHSLLKRKLQKVLFLSPVGLNQPFDTSRTNRGAYLPA